MCSILLITVDIQYHSITHNPTINFILIFIYYTYVPSTKFIVSVVSEVTKKDWRRWIRETGLVHRTATSLPFVPAFVRSTIIRRKFFVQQIVWFPFPSFCWLSSLSLLSLKIPWTKKKKKKDWKRKRMMSVHPIGEQWTHIASTPFPLSLSRRRRRIVRVEGHAWVCTRSAWVRGVHTRLGSSTCKCQWRLKIGRLSETRNLSLSSGVHTRLLKVRMVSTTKNSFVRWPWHPTTRSDEITLRRMMYDLMVWRQGVLLLSLWYCVNEDVREECKCN